jgi:hypothetical protein
MEDSRFAVDFREYSVAAATCPICTVKFTVRLHWSYLIAHKDEELKIVCLSCAKEKINEIKNGRVN